MQKERDTEPQPLTLEAVAARAKEDLLRDGQHRPTLIAEGGLRTVVAQVNELGPTHEQRAKQMFVLGFGLAQSGEVAELEQAFFISEAWMSEERDGQAPHSHPRKTRTGEKSCWFLASSPTMKRWTWRSWRWCGIGRGG